MALEMEDITPAKDGGVLKKVIKQGTGNIVPDKAIVRGMHVKTSTYFHTLVSKKVHALYVVHIWVYENSYIYLIITVMCQKYNNDFRIMDIYISTLVCVCVYMYVYLFIYVFVCFYSVYIVVCVCSVCLVCVRT